MTNLVAIAALTLALGGPTPTPDPSPSRSPVDAAAPAFDHDHAAWSRILALRVHDGVVDYAGLSRDPAPLHAYLASLEALGAEAYARFRREEKLAFWINAYNAYTVKLILDHYPVTSIKKVGGLFRSSFALEFIPLGLRGGGPLSLNTIEHEILRKELLDPRIHAALVCAAKSCPRLRSEAYRAAAVDRQLEEEMRAFVNDRERNRWEASTRTLHLSAIFKWFREDFEAGGSTLLDFVVRRLDPEPAAAITKGPRPAIAFLDYNWSLNGR